MSTRANIIICDEHDKMWFYRQSDGYPDGALPTLKEFMRRVASGEISDNAGQAAGWLIVIGHEEYKIGHEEYKKYNQGWKVGAYEPTTGRHGDIEFLYILNLSAKTIEVYETACFGPVDNDKLINTITDFSRAGRSAP
jgi:hypothetical protein